MDKQFTASEVRDWERAYKGTGAAKVFGAFADLLEAQEKAVPVAECGHSSTVEHRASNANVTGSSPAARSNSDAERLAEALRNARIFVLHFGDEPARVCIAEIDAALAAHSAQAQPNIPDLTDEEWEILFHLYPELKARLQKVFDAHDAQAQPPPASDDAEQLALCREDWQSVCDVIHPGWHFNPEEIIARLKQPPATRVPDWTDAQCVAFMAVGLRHTEYKKGKSPTVEEIRQGAKAALAAQENPNE